MRIVGRKPKLTPEQQAELRRWASIGKRTGEAARYFGICTTTLNAYLRGEQKQPIRDTA